MTYRYHQVLQTHLEVVLVDELGSPGGPRALRTQRRLLEEAGHPGAAVRAHARAEDWGAVARLLQPGAPAVGQGELLWGSLALPGAPVDDPGLVLAGARRLLRHGQVVESVAAFRRAEALLDDVEFRRRCARERVAATYWLPGAAPVEPAEAGASLALSAGLRRLTRLPGAAADAPILMRGLAALLAGDVAAAAQLLGRDAPPAPDTPWEPLARRLAVAVVGLVAGTDDDGAAALEEIVLTADVDGWPWLSRIARGMQTVLLLLHAPGPGLASACADLVSDLQRTDDLWGRMVLSLAVGWGYARIGWSEPALTSLRLASETARALDAPVFQRWAELFIARVESGEMAAETGSGAAEGGSAAADPGPVDLTCLGPFSLRVNGTEVGWRALRPRSRNLLMLLAARHGTPVHRELLVDALWPEASLAAGVRSLQVAVSSVRQCLGSAGLGSECVVRRGDTYALVLPGVRDRRAEFEALAERADRAAQSGRLDESLRHRMAALDCYAGDLLPETGPAEWVLEPRSRLRLLAATLSAAAAEEALHLGDLTAGLRAARRSVALDPYHDGPWTLLAELYRRTGDWSGAAVAEREHARIRAELGV